jgi:hypothetical protein
MLISLPGTPIVDYGDEIGMGDNINSGDRNAEASLALIQSVCMPLIQDPVS